MAFKKSSFSHTTQHANDSWHLDTFCTWADNATSPWVDYLSLTALVLTVVRKVAHDALGYFIRQPMKIFWPAVSNGKTLIELQQTVIQDRKRHTANHVCQIRSSRCCCSSQETIQVWTIQTNSCLPNSSQCRLVRCWRCVHQLSIDGDDGSTVVRKYGLKRTFRVTRILCILFVMK